MKIGRKIAGVVVLVLLVLVGVRFTSDAVNVTCGATTTTPDMVRALDVTADAGQLVNEIARPDHEVKPMDVVRFVWEIRERAGIVWDNLTAHGSGKGEPTAATGIRTRVLEAQQAAMDSCCPGVPMIAPPGVDSPPAGSWDPRMASMSTGGRLTGAALAADALRRAGFPEREIPMGVAVATAESTLNPDPPNPPPGMRGMWQINSNAHPQLMDMGDWRDPYVNARMAYEVWKDAGGWSPWSTAASARGQLAPAPPASSAAAPAGPPVGIVTWNAYRLNSDAKVVAGVRKLAAIPGVGLIGLQEMGSSARRAKVRAAMPGWRMIGNNAVPILVHPQLKILARDSVQAIGRRPAELGAGGVRHVGPKWINTVTVEAGGQVFSEVNTHMIATVSKGGQFDHRKPRRVNAFLDHQEDTIRVAKRLTAQGPVAVSMDRNTTFDPMGKWAAAGFRSSNRAATHGDRSIDDVLVSGMTPTSVQVRDKSGSDHSAVVAGFGGPGGMSMSCIPAGQPADPNLPATVKDPAKIPAQGSDFEGAAAAANRLGASPVTPHSDPQGDRAFDAMVPHKSATGDALARHMIDNRDQYGVKYVIWNMRIWSDQNWAGRPYSPISSGGDFRHVNHVHVSFRSRGA